MTISLTPNAAKRIQTILAESGNQATAVRLEVLGGGCSGFQYKFGYADGIDDAQDTFIEEHGARLVIDAISRGFLEGSTVDYKESIMEAGFVVLNPNAGSSCGCGSSFSIKE